MLTTLRIKNLALVEQVLLEFGPGLNTITGETGAGKSILMGALGLLLGERADKTLIRAGQDACGAEAQFQLADSADVDVLLEEMGLDPCEDGQLVIRRIVKAGSGGQILVNDAPVTLQGLKRLGQYLVDMHGPHDHQSLLKPEAQLDILDAFGHLWDERAAFEEVYRRLQLLDERRAELEQDVGHVDELVDLLTYRVKEIADAALEEGEEEKLTQEHSLVGHAQRILELSSEILTALTEGEPSAFDCLAGSRRALGELARLMPEAGVWQDEVDELTQRVQELAASVGRTAGDIQSEPVRLEWLDQRIALYKKLRKKYGPTVADVLQTLEDSRRKLNDLETRSERLEALDKEREALDKEMRRTGQELRKKRKLASTRLAKAITKELKELGFAHGSFAVDLEKAEPHISGLDQVEFGFEPNEGEPMRPLRAIASSGEISRVMLATKAVLADHDRIPILVFDEIDANLGGEMGHAVGRKLSHVARNHQVICITHLPQVAVFGTSHFAVSKEIRAGRTVSIVEQLGDAESRAREVARMLGHSGRAGAALDHARELLSNV